MDKYILASALEQELRLYSGAIRQAIFHGRILEHEAKKIAGRWFVLRSAVERAFNDYEKRIYF